jgi:hypothetical protein
MGNPRTPGVTQIRPAGTDLSRVVMLPIELEEFVERVAARVVEQLAQTRSAHAEPDRIDAVEMARRLSLSRTTLHRLRRQGMPAIPVGDTYRSNPAAVLAWLETRGRGG